MSEGNHEGQFTRSDSGFYTTPSVISLRLNTEGLLQELERFLSGRAEVVQETKDGGFVQHMVKIGEPLANVVGIQYILLRVKAIVNSQTVQGNFKEETLNQYLGNIEESLGVMVCNNCYKWKIEDDDQDTIVDYIMDLIQPFMSRTLNNEERKSYSNTIEHKESSVMQEKSGFSVFKK